MSQMALRFTVLFIVLIHHGVSLADQPAQIDRVTSEKAISRGLIYLIDRQNRNGSWSLQGHGTDVLLHSDSAATGLCLLAFLEAPNSMRQKHDAVIQSGIEYLVNVQDEEGNLYGSENDVSDNSVAFYSHAIATRALCDALRIRKDPALESPAQRAIDYIAASQHRMRGGWRYTPQKSSDTSVTCQMALACAAAKRADVQVPAAIDEGLLRWIKFCEMPGTPQQYRYNPFAPDTDTQRHGRWPSPCMTAAGGLIRLYANGNIPDQRDRSSSEFIFQYLPQFRVRSSPRRDVYYWYLSTLFMNRIGGEYAKRWQDTLLPMLLNSQVRTAADTSGEPGASWQIDYPDPDRWGMHAGPIYLTAMHVLTIESIIDQRWPSTPE
ncbi:prenyltransferase/squalene oxidase repeat-containing protein [Stieleria varia]|uniref:Squalene cyclase C-terminal domain-containing protein n=1 Tax=Stieleria varia TaxID=2528005 RepID=A0A5C6AFM5_9BACT|nr:prenyltransferase/squalene oxidase repeat-containing protein [Stieleria varia]TWT98226.1 hypothetical protein Pla52n_47360 [Stieleria varia]